MRVPRALNPAKLGTAIVQLFSGHNTSVLRSKRAVQINVQIIQTFIRLRQWALTHEDLAQKIAKLESGIRTHDKRIRTIFEALRELINPPESPRKPIGFRPQSDV